MDQDIKATFENGLLRPDEKLDLPEDARVRLVIQPLKEWPAPSPTDWEEFEKLCEEISVDSGGVHMTRDQLHERR